MSQTFRVTHPKSDTSARNEYFLACFFSVGVGLARLGTRSGLGTGLIFIGVVILFIAIGIYYQFGRSLGSDQEEDPERPSPTRLYRMALIWYALSVVLSASFVRDLVRFLGGDHGAEIGPLQWGMGVLGGGVAGFALWRIVVIVTMVKKQVKT
ncbi:MAG: hypothetical protein GY762_00545 [Proteobacteria bacterium]|nr:hypothetical protein [Pseudomonadota bacterium]